MTRRRELPELPELPELVADGPWGELVQLPFGQVIETDDACIVTGSDHERDDDRPRSRRLPRHENAQRPPGRGERQA